MNAAPIRSQRARFVPSVSFEEGLLAFARHLLEGSLVLPTRPHAGQLYRETAERIGRMIPAGLLGFLARRGGWHRQPMLVGERIVRLRIWESPLLRSLALPVTEAEIRLLVELYRVAFPALGGERLDESTLEPVGRAIDAVQRGDSPTASLLQHAVSWPFARQSRGRPLVVMLCRGDGLNQITIGLDPDLAVAPNAADVTRALQTWGWAMPWLGESVAAWWLRAYDKRFAHDLAGFSTTITRLTQAAGLVWEYARTAGDVTVLAPLLHFLTQAHPADIDPDEACEALDWMLEDEPHMARQEWRDLWAELLAYGNRLRELQRTLVVTHPLEREDDERVFLTIWESMSFDTVVDRVETLRTHLQRVLQ